MFCIVPNVYICLHCQSKKEKTRLTKNFKQQKNYKMKNSNTQTQTLSNKPMNGSNNEMKNATSKNHFEKNVFSCADLWNIHKTSRTAFVRRRSNLMM